MSLITSIDEITEYLDNVKKLINLNENNLIISSRNKNLEFMSIYNLRKNDVIKLINKLESDNFEDKVVNRHEEYKNEVLYIFSLDV